MTITRPTYEGRPLHDPTEPVEDQGLAFDVDTVVSRRQALRLFGGAAGGLLLAACGVGSGSSSSATPTATSASGSASGDACGDVIPQETAGPYPGDGTNGPDVLSEDGIVRQDLTTSFGAASGTAEGVPLEIALRILDGDDGCGPYAGAAVYLWQCDREGRYSLYSEGATDQNYLRGVQEADTDGIVRFTSIFPACYAGRWPHLHFEVFPSLRDAADAGNAITTSQVALPADACDQVYATAGYEASVQTLAQVTLDGDNVFGEDGGVDQLGATSGTVDDGLAVTLDVVVSATAEPVGAGMADRGGPAVGRPGWPTGGPGPHDLTWSAGSF